MIGKIFKRRNSFAKGGKPTALVVTGMLIQATLVTSTSVLANPFWANPLGGGVDDIVEKHVFPSGYQSRSNADWIEPSYDSAGNLIYEVKADSKASVVFTDTDIDAVIVQAQETSTEAVSGRGNQLDRPGRNIRNGDELERGNWRITAPGQIKEKMAVGKLSNDTAPPAIRVDLENSPYSLSFRKSELSTLRGMRVTITAKVTDNTGPILPDDSVSLSAYPLENAKVTATINFADGTSQVKTLRDNGNRRFADENRGDNIYTFMHHFQSPGMHYIDLVADGEVDGQPFRRQTNIYVLISSNRLANKSNTINATQGEIFDLPLEEGRFGLPVEVQVMKGAIPDILDTYAEIWAKDSAGMDSVVGWTGGLVKPVKESDNRYVIPMSFHSGWLAADDFSPPYTLRNLVFKDSDTGEQMLTNAQKVVRINDLYADSSSRHIGSEMRVDAKGKFSPSNAMLRGIHPAQLKTASAKSFMTQGSTQSSAQFKIAPPFPAPNNSNPRVLSMHGFCATGKDFKSYSSKIQNDSWDYPGSRNVNAKTYADEVAAWLKYTPGSIRGVVAHSQGGLAAATLINKYSYLFADNALSRPVNILSMGSPYLGTRLLNLSPSNIAAAFVVSIGSVVFQSCTIPYELYPSLNHRWRNDFVGTAGLRARTQIESWVTTHKKRKNEPFNCGLSSFVISGHDDGIISYYDTGSFPGKQEPNRYEWCHTASLGENQWRHPDFLNRVNTHFGTAFESWQPYNP